MSELSSFKPQSIARRQLLQCGVSSARRKLINPFLNMISTPRSTPRLKPLCAVVRSSQLHLSQRSTPSIDNSPAFFSSGSKTDASLPVLALSKSSTNKHRLRVRRATNPVLCSFRRNSDSKVAEPRATGDSLPVEVSFGRSSSEAKTLLI